MTEFHVDKKSISLVNDKDDKAAKQDNSPVRSQVQDRSSKITMSRITGKGSSDARLNEQIASLKFYKDQQNITFQDHFNQQLCIGGPDAMRIQE